MESRVGRARPRPRYQGEPTSADGTPSQAKACLAGTEKCSWPGAVGFPTTHPNIPELPQALVMEMVVSEQRGTVFEHVDYPLSIEIPENAAEDDAFRTRWALVKRVTRTERCAARGIERYTCPDMPPGEPATHAQSDASPDTDP